ncbi:MAG: L-seryl-tRNA(Sec) selenium transferase, partial [Bacilli bacterium]
SRGQLVEIGGSFRVSEIMRESGSKLVEVGTTNKTHVYDYERAITDRTALLMKVHTSNFRMIGFTETVNTRSLVEMGLKHNIPVYEDVGSGVLTDLSPYGIQDEPTVHEVVKSGVDLVSFSGDKLLGGPQAGLIVGKKKWIDQLKNNQLARVLRIDKFTIAALQATLLHYARGTESATSSIPTLRAMSRTVTELNERAQMCVSLLTSRWENSPAYNKPLHLEIVTSKSAIGGGSLPGFEIPTVVVSVQAEGIPVYELENSLRKSVIPIIGRIQHDHLLLDMRTIEPEEVPTVVDSFIHALSKLLRI